MYLFIIFFFFKQKTAYEMRISDWSSDVCSSDLHRVEIIERQLVQPLRARSPDPRVVHQYVDAAETLDHRREQGRDAIGPRDVGDACPYPRQIGGEPVQSRGVDVGGEHPRAFGRDRKSTRLNSSH